MHSSIVINVVHIIFDRSHLNDKFIHILICWLAFSPTSTYEELVQSKCSSCNVREDNSAYWAPALYFMDSDHNTVEVVPEKPPHKS